MPKQKQCHARTMVASLRASSTEFSYLSFKKLKTIFKFSIVVFLCGVMKKSERKKSKKGQLENCSVSKVIRKTKKKILQNSLGI